jgi:hypothetical protein
MPAPPRALRTLAERYDPEVLDAPAGGARVRFDVSDDDGAWDVIVDPEGARHVEPVGEPQAQLRAAAATLRAVAADVRGGMDAFRAPG